MMAFSARKKKTPLIEESDSSTNDEKSGTEDYSFSDDELQSASTQSKVTPRSSERIQKKRNRKFHVPSKKEVWESISPGKSPGKYDQLKPRKLVNNFTKENNRYNYDPNETSGDESLDDFIINDDECVESSTSSDSACDIKAKKSMRIRGRHHRLRVGNPIDESSSSDSDVELETEGESAAAVENGACGDKPRHSVRLRSQDKHWKSDSDVDLDDINERRKGKRNCTKGKKYSSPKKRKHNTCVIEDDNVEEPKPKYESSKRRKNNKSEIEDLDVRDSDTSCDSDDNVPQVRKCGKRNRSVIESDAESVESEIRVGRRNKHKRSVIESDSDEGVEVIMKDAELQGDNSNGNFTSGAELQLSRNNDSTTGRNTQSSTEVVEIVSNKADTITETHNTGIVHESDGESVQHNGLGTDEDLTKPNASTSNPGSKSEEELNQLPVPVCEVTTSTNKSPGSIVSVSDESSDASSDDTEEDSKNSISESDDDNSDDSELDDDLDVDTENSRIRIGKLHKKRAKEKLFEKLRKERERKLSKSK